jgi:hypothetical protein
MTSPSAGGTRRRNGSSGRGPANPGPHNEGCACCGQRPKPTWSGFLAAEVTSERYGPQITEILARLGQPRGIADQPDTSDEAANAIRRQVLAAYRDYPSGDVFTGMPADVRWHHAALTPAELATVRYIDYDYWTEFSGGTRLAADGAGRLGPWQHMAPRTCGTGGCPSRSSCSASPARRT